MGANNWLYPYPRPPTFFELSFTKNVQQDITFPSYSFLPLENVLVKLSSAKLLGNVLGVMLPVAYKELT